MIEDNQIQAKVSPFAMRKGEIKVFDGKDGYVSMNQIIQKINIGHISEVHFGVLKFINKFEFLTSRQLFQLLKLENYDIKDQDKLNNKLEQLIKNKILTRYYFTSEEGNGIYRVYCMEKMGKYLLTSREMECNWQPSDNAKPVEMIKKKLSGNQLVIAYMRKSHYFTNYTLKPVITAKEFSKKFKPTVLMEFNYENKKFNFIFESIRREENWENKLIERMKLWKDFYDNFVPGDSEFSALPQLVFLSEDNMHSAEIFKTLLMNKVNISQITHYFTTDLAQNEENLAKSLYDFVLENGKYKLRNVEAKILG